eukprot:6199653-Pleurochrysis_carterae.AAC.2
MHAPSFESCPPPYHSSAGLRVRSSPARPAVAQPHLAHAAQACQRRRPRRGASTMRANTHARARTRTRAREDARARAKAHERAQGHTRARKSTHARMKAHANAIGTAIGSASTNADANLLKKATFAATILACTYAHKCVDARPTGTCEAACTEHPMLCGVSDAFLSVCEQAPIAREDCAFFSLSCAERSCGATARAFAALLARAGRAA